MSIKYILNPYNSYLLIASVQTYFIYHMYTKMNQVEHMRHMMDKIYIEQLNLKNNTTFSFTKDASTNTILSEPPSPNNDDIPSASYFSLGTYLNKKENK